MNRLPTGRVVLGVALCLQAVIAGARPFPAARKQPRIAQPRWVAGRVVNPDGKPAIDATVTINRTESQSQQSFVQLRTDAQGNFKLSLKNHRPAPWSSLLVTACTRSSGIATVAVPGVGAAAEHITLKAISDVSLSGRLLNTSGSPAARVPVFVSALTSHIEGFGSNALVTKSFMNTADVNIANSNGQLRGLNLIEPTIASSRYRAVTDANGRFTITGLPTGSSVFLKCGGGLSLAPDSNCALAINHAGDNSIGTLIGVRPSTLQVRVTDETGRHPQNAAAVQMVGLTAPNQASNTSSEGYKTGADGRVEIKDLMPGDYMAVVHGRAQTVHVSEGTVSPLSFALRSGPLTGRVLDADGRPMSGQPVMVRYRFRNPAMPTRAATDVDAGWEMRAVAYTAGDGRFEIPNFEWGYDEVVLRSTRGHDRAELRSAPGAIGGSVNLRMQRNVLIAVSGRLIDTARKPLARAVAQALHWQPTPRSAWFASAHTIISDAHGRFLIDGLERGESFSIITPGRNAKLQQQALEDRRTGRMRHGARLAALSTVSAVTDFESPRFAVSRSVAAQDLGDVMIHPSSTPDQVIESYGGGNPVVASAGIVSAPSAVEVRTAADTLREYFRAARAGDLNRLHALTSKANRDYRESLSDFAVAAPITTLTSGTDTTLSGLEPVRYLSRNFVAASVAGVSGFQSAFSNSFAIASGASFSNSLRVISGERFRQDINGFDGMQVNNAQININSGMNGANALRSGDWLALSARVSGQKMFAGLMHRENGAWRVVTASPRPQTPISLLSAMGALQFQAPQKIKPPRLPIDQYAEARGVGERYLAAWSLNRPEAQRRMTAQHTIVAAANVQQFAEIQERRPDQGLCPIRPGARAIFRPLPDLTAEEYSTLLNNAATRTFRAFTDTTNVLNNMQFLQKAAARNETALLQYDTPSGPMLIALAKEKGAWKVVEPALPM